MSSPNPDNAVATIQKYANGPVKNNTLTKSPFYYWVSKKGKTEHSVGGTRYSPQGYIYNVQTPVGWSRTHMGTFPDPVMFKGLVFDWTGYIVQYMTLAWDKMENQSGDTRRFDREKEILKAVKRAWMPFYETKFWLDNSSSTPAGVVGMAGFMKVTGTYGGQDLSTAAWKPTSINGATALSGKTFATDPLAYIRNTVNTHATKGNTEGYTITDKPEIGFCTQAEFEFLQSYFTTKATLPMTVSTDEAGLNFDNLMIAGVRHFWSPSCTSAEINYINPEDFQTIYQTDEDIVVRQSEPDQPIGQLTQMYNKFWFGCINPYNQARLHTTGVT